MEHSLGNRIKRHAQHDSLPVREAVTTTLRQEKGVVYIPLRMLDYALPYLAFVAITFVQYFASDWTFCHPDSV